MISVDAAKFARAFVASSTEATRYYLNGVHVEKDPRGGAILVATDGSILVAIRDGTGTAEEAGVIVKVSKDALKACKDGRRVEVEGDQLRVMHGETPVYIQAGEARIDGSFPAWRRVVPRNASLTPPAAYIVEPTLLVRLSKALDVINAKRPSVSLLATGGPRDPFLAYGFGGEEAFGVIMPVLTKGDARSDVPGWHL